MNTRGPADVKLLAHPCSPFPIYGPLLHRTPVLDEQRACNRFAKSWGSRRFEIPTAQGTALALSCIMSERLRKKIRERAEKREFADQLMDIATRIERDFEGDERERLLALVHEALDRHVEIREQTRAARDALIQLQADQRALLRLFDFITARPERATIH